MTMSSTNESGSDTLEALAHRHHSIVTAARAGWVAKGIVYVLLGVIAVPIALQGGEESGSEGQEASQSGAVARLAESSWGAAALWIVGIGLLLYAVWRLVSLFLPAENDAKAWATRAGYAISVVVNVVLGWTAISYAQGTASSSGSQSEDAKVEQFTRDLMDGTAGRWLVGAIGVGVVAVGIYFIVKGIKASFRDELEPAGVGPISHEAIVKLGQVGFVGRGLVLGLVGWFLVRAAVNFDPEEAAGIDGALREVTGSTWGSLLVGFIAVAVIVYGAFCIISAPRQRLVGAD
jgi:hypothetical protein